MKTFQLTQVAALIVAASAADIKPYGQVPAATVLEQVEAEAQHCPCHDHDHCDCDNEPLVAVNVYEADECCDSDPESEPIPEPEDSEDPETCPVEDDCDIGGWCECLILTYGTLFDHVVN